MRTLRDAHDAYYAALDGIWEGDVAPMAALWSRADDVTLFGACGRTCCGRSDVLAYYDDVVRRTTTGAIRDRDTHLREVGDAGYSVCIEEGYTIVDGIRAAVLRRSTSVFRREQGGWHLIHHHDDAAIDAQLESPPSHRSASPSALF